MVFEEQNNSPKYVSFLRENRTLDQAKKIYEQRIIDARDVYEKFSSSFFARKCPVCGGGVKRDLPNFQGVYHIKECAACLTNYVDPCPSLDALSYYYNKCECNALHAELLRGRYKNKNIILSERTEFVIELIDKYLKNKSSIRILEVGCSSGTFLSELKEALSVKYENRKISYFGIDIDENAISKNVDPNISLYAASVEDFSKSIDDYFDLVLHFELIEHLQDPFSFMKSVRRIISKDGLHHFHTPNANGLDNKALKYNDFRPLAHGIFPPMHLQAFTPMNIMHFALRSGFNVVQLDTPGSFDVDIVKIFGDSNDSLFGDVKRIPEEFLAIFQHWLKALCASSHMRVTLSA